MNCKFSPPSIVVSRNAEATTESWCRLSMLERVQCGMARMSNFPLTLRKKSSFMAKMVSRMEHRLKAIANFYEKGNNLCSMR